MAYSVLIKNGVIIDGSGQAPYRADIGISDDRIKDIGDLSNEKSDKIIDATNLYVTPGFIDLTNHSDTYGTLFSTPLQESMLLQGVTTILLGNCGESLAPIANQISLEALERWTHTPFNADWNSMEEYLNTLLRVGKGVNVASLVGQETLRRNARTTEEMVYLLTQAMDEGALGLSSNFSLVAFDDALDKETLALLGVVRRKKFPARNSISAQLCPEIRCADGHLPLQGSGEKCVERLRACDQYGRTRGKRRRG